MHILCGYCIVHDTDGALDTDSCVCLCICVYQGGHTYGAHLRIDLMNDTSMGRLVFHSDCDNCTVASVNFNMFRSRRH